MLRFILKRIIQGVFVLAGTLVVVFLLFYVLPGDPARGITGQRTDSVTIAAIHKELGLDKPLSIQFLTYLNDLSPISIHSEYDEDHYLYLDPNEYGPYIKLFSFGDTTAIEKSSDLLRMED